MNKKYYKCKEGLSHIPLYNKWKINESMWILLKNLHIFMVQQSVYNRSVYILARN